MPTQSRTVRCRPPQNWAILFMVVGVGTAGYLLSTAVRSLVRSEVPAAYGERRRHREMGKLPGHYIIRGAGRVGRRFVDTVSRPDPLATARGTVLQSFTWGELSGQRRLSASSCAARTGWATR